MAKTITSHLLNSLRKTLNPSLQSHPPFRSFHYFTAGKSPIRLTSLSPTLPSKSSISHLSASFASRDYTSSSANGDDGTRDWMELSKKAVRSAVDSLEKTKEAVENVREELKQLVDSSSVLSEVVVPVGGIAVGTVFAWWVMPKVLRKIHKVATQTQGYLGGVGGEIIPYEKSVWGALEEPVRYLVTFMAFAQLAVMIAPTSVPSQYIGQTWRGALVLSLVWFLYRWKTNAFNRYAAKGMERERLMTFDKLSTFGLFVLGLMAAAEASGMAVQSILTVGGIGGAATAFAARDILGNAMSGLSIQFSRPFSIGDSIKAGSVEGQVVSIGLTTTSLLSTEKYLVMVPNSMFSSQVIVNKSRANLRALVTKVPLQIHDVEKIPDIAEDIHAMLKLIPHVYLEREAPYCVLSKIEDSYAELTIGCNVTNVSRTEFYSIVQDVLLESALIIKKHGAELGSTRESWNN